jgi:cell division protein FtsL
MASASRAVRATPRPTRTVDVVREPRRRLQVVARRRRRLWLTTVVAVVVFAAMAALIVVQLRSAAAQRELDSIRKQRREVIAYNERLKLAVDRLQAPEVIMSQALALGLQIPQQRTRLVPQPEQLAEAAAGPAGTTPPSTVAMDVQELVPADLSPLEPMPVAPDQPAEVAAPAAAAPVPTAPSEAP